MERELKFTPISPEQLAHELAERTQNLERQALERSSFRKPLM